MKDVGIGIRKIRHLRLHAKMLLADRSRAIVGSINLAPGSFDKGRELAIRVKDEDIESYRALCTMIGRIRVRSTSAIMDCNSI